MPGVGVQVQKKFGPVVLRQGFTGSVLKKLIAEATPEANNDHLQVILSIIASKLAGWA